MYKMSLLKKSTVSDKEKNYHCQQPQMTETRVAMKKTIQERSHVQW